MMYGPNHSLGSYLPQTYVFPDDDRDLKPLLGEMYRKIADAVNNRVIGSFSFRETINGERFYTNKGLSQCYRVVIDFGQLPSSSIKSVPHKIDINPKLMITRLYGAATHPSTSFIPLPFVNVANPSDGVQLDMDATNVNVKTTSSNFSVYEKCFIVIEYIKLI